METVTYFVLICPDMMIVGTSIFVVGEVIASPAKGQKVQKNIPHSKICRCVCVLLVFVLVVKDVFVQVEMKASEVRILGQSDPVSYPLAGKNLTLEYYRSVQHFRPRSMVVKTSFRPLDVLCVMYVG